MHRSTPTTNSADVDRSKTLHRRGAEAARGAHNSKVTRSRRVAGIFLFVCFTEALRHCQATLNTAQPLHRRGAEGSARGS